MNRALRSPASWGSTLRLGAGLLPALATAVGRGGRPLLRKLSGSHQTARLNLFFCSETLGTPIRDLPALARRTLCYRLLNDLDFERLRWSHYTGTGLERLREVLADGRGAVLVSQHFGAYRRFYHELLRRGFDVSLVADAQVSGDLHATTGSRLRRQGVRASVVDDRLRRFEVIDAEQRGSVRRIWRALDANRVVLFYLDGNTGTEAPGSAEGASGPAVIRGLGHDLKLRLGLAEIAHRRGQPIVPVFCHWLPGLDPAFEVLPPIRQPSDISAREAATRSAELFFELFTARLRRAPAQFEHLIYLHRWLAPAPTVTEDELATARDGVERRLAAAAGVRWAPTRAALFDLGGRRVLAQSRAGRLVAARGALLAAAEALSGARGDALPWPRLRAATALGEVELIQALAVLDTFDMIDWHP